MEPCRTAWLARCAQVPWGRTMVVHQFPIASLSTISSSLNSLFRVLCIFPLRYLYAIGLPPVFSLGWSIPPLLGLHFQATRLFNHPLARGRSQGQGSATGVSPSMPHLSRWTCSTCPYWWPFPCLRGNGAKPILHCERTI